MSRRLEIRVPSLGEPISHYTDAVRAGDLLFISGCVASEPGGGCVGRGDVVAQTRRTLENIGTILAAAGAGFADVVKVTVYLRNMEDRARINPVRQEFFGDSYPASTLVEVSKLAHPDFLIEIDAVAVLPDPPS